MFSASSLLLSSSLLGLSIQATTVTHDASFVPDAILSVTAANVTTGCVERYSAMVNNSIPGPELRFSADRTYWIRVWNYMKDANLTMHWHGLSQAAAPFSDGTPQAAQWPIPPNNFFDYELDLRTVSPGSYFYHSHVGFQAVSVSGPLIIEDADDCRPPYDSERMVFLSDVFNETDIKIQDGLLASPFVWSGETNAVLFNGIGATQTSTITKGEGCGMAKIHVQPDTTYRFRFINAAALSFLSLAIEDHDSLSITEADGESTQPYNVSFLQVGAGQRYSAVIKTKSCEELANLGKLEYYMQAETRERPTLTRSYATLKYRNNCSLKNQSEADLVIPTGSVLDLPPTQLGYLDYDLRPLSDNDFPTLSEITRRVTVTVQQIVGSNIIWDDDKFSWTVAVAPYPYLVALYDDVDKYLPDYDYAVANGGIDNRVGAFPARIGEVLEIVIQNSGATNGGLDVHPFHMHGAHYYDIGSGNGTYDIATNEARLNGTSPVRRDTTMLYRYGNQTTPGANAGWRAWRIRVTEPGVWMMHCHILQHMIMGMQTVWVFGNETSLMTLPKPEVQGYLTYGGNVYGNSSHHPRVVHYRS